MSIVTIRDQQGSYTKINRLNIERFWTSRSALLPKSTRIRRGRQNDALKNGLFEAHQGLPPTAALRAVMAHAPAAPDGALRALGARCARVFCFLHKYRMCASFFPTAASPRLLRHIDRQGVGRSQHASVFYPDATFLTQTADSMVRSSFWRHRCVHSSCLRGLLAPLPFPASVPLLFARRPRHAVGYRRLTTVPLVRVVLAG